MCAEKADGHTLGHSHGIRLVCQRIDRDDEDVLLPERQAVAEALYIHSRNLLRPGNDSGFGHVCVKYAYCRDIRQTFQLTDNSYRHDGSRDGVFVESVADNLETIDAAPVVETRVACESVLQAAPEAEESEQRQRQPDDVQRACEPRAAVHVEYVLYYLVHGR